MTFLRSLLLCLFLGTIGWAQSDVGFLNDGPAEFGPFLPSHKPSGEFQPPSISPFQQGETVKQRLQQTLDNIARSINGTGTAMAVYIPGRGLWSGVAGYAIRGVTIVRDANNRTVRDEYGGILREGAVKMTTGDLLYVGSCSKVMVAAAILQLQEEGKLLLSDTLEHWLPNTGIRYADRITLRQMLSHTSGIFNYTNAEEMWIQLLADPTAAYSPWYFLNYVLTKAVAFPPGKAGAWEYSNTNFLLGGLIIEKVDGRPLDQALHTRLFDRVASSGVYNSGFAEDPHTRVIGYNPDGTVAPFFQMSWSYGAGQIVASAEGYTRLLHELFAGDLLQPDSLAEMVRPNDTTYYYGLGVGNVPVVLLGKSTNLITHDGRIPGFISRYLHDTQTGVTVMQMLNADSTATGANHPLNASFYALEIGVAAAQATAVEEWEMMEVGSH